MIKFLADEDFNNRIVRGLLRRLPDLDIVRVQDTPLFGAPDAAVLEWAAGNGRILLTHVVSTITRFAYQRIRSGQPMAGVIEISQAVPIGQVIDDVILITIAGAMDEYENQIVYLPF